MSNRTIKVDDAEYELVPYYSVSDPALKGSYLLKLIPAEPKGRRAETDTDYWYVDNDLRVEKTNDIHTAIDDYRYNAGNYFRTNDQAECAVPVIRAVFDYMRRPEGVESPYDLKGLIKRARVLIHGEGDAS